MGTTGPSLRRELRGFNAALFQAVLLLVAGAIFYLEKPFSDNLTRIGSLYTVLALLAAWFLSTHRCLPIALVLTILPVISWIVGNQNPEAAIAQALSVILISTITLRARTLRVREARAVVARTIAEQRLERVNNVSHELRTPLSIIRGHADVLAHDSSLAPRQRQSVAHIVEASAAMVALTDEILNEDPWWLELPAARKRRARKETSETSRSKPE